MRQFASTKDYLNAFRSEPALAIISMQMAADALEVGRGAIANRLTAGSLEGVRVGRTRFVLASAIVKVHADRDAEVATVEAEIVKVARAGRTTPYAPLMAKIGRSTTVPHDRKRIGEILGDISRRSHAEHGFLLSALVINATLDRPSDSFFGLATEIDPSYARAKSDEAYLARQTRLIHDHYRPARQSAAAKGGTAARGVKSRKKAA